MSDALLNRCSHNLGASPPTYHFRPEQDCNDEQQRNGYDSAPGVSRMYITPMNLWKSIECLERIWRAILVHQLHRHSRAFVSGRTWPILNFESSQQRCAS